jgi:endonuclease/exonuclease/phosphatase family metal-dependent hydrolase
MILITWNVQWCRGVDGNVDPGRIVDTAKASADFDVLCLQEVADYYPHPRLAGSRGGNQFGEIARRLPDYVAVEGVAVDQPSDDGRRRRFGNMILSRLPVRQIYRHLLPYPCEPGVPGMPRGAVEAVVGAPGGDVRVITTHLEYYSQRARFAQIDALRRIYADGYAHARDAFRTGSDEGPFETFAYPRETLICGDCNFEPSQPEHARMIAPLDGLPGLIDAWKHLHPGKPHPATFRIHEKEKPGDPELHCDLVFVNADLAPRVRRIDVEQQTQASDHQPVIVTIES